MTKEKKGKVLEAAMTAFMRYGYRRVTMSDIAQEAGMSRPALYLVFKNKEEIFRAVVAQFSGEALTEVRMGLESKGSVRDRLEFVFDVWVIRGYEIIHTSPDAKELVDCSYGFAGDVVAQGYAAFEDLIASIIAPHAGRLHKVGLTPQRLARIMAWAARGFKENANDVDELRQLISGLITMVLSTLAGLGQDLPAKP